MGFKQRKFTLHNFLSGWPSRQKCSRVIQKNFAAIKPVTASGSIATDDFEASQVSPGVPNLQ